MRIPAGPPSNRGFELNLAAGSLAGSTASVEGYYGEAITPFTERNLHYFLLEIEGGVLLNAGSPEVSVTRPQCRQRNGRAEYHVLGNTHDPNSGTVIVRNNATNALLGTAAVAADADDPTFGAYNFAGR